MPLKTDTFGITRYWLATALTQVPRRPDLLAGANRSLARKAFLAGTNQLTAIKNWLSHAEVLALSKGSAELTELGRLIAAQDERAERAWTWWLIHIHLTTNRDAFPYAQFFLLSDAEGLTWRTSDQIVETLAKFAKDTGMEIEESTVQSYFEGVDNAFKSGRPLHSLGLIERRDANDGNGKKRLRRALTRPADIVVAYATALFQNTFLQGQPTVEARVLLEKGLARSLGLRDADLRESLRRISQHSALGQFLQYRQQVNLDSVQFLKSGDGALRSIRMQAYNSQDVKWP
jgi:hypothetical protein